MPEILQLRSPADLRGNVVKGALTNGGFLVTDVTDLEEGMKLLRLRCRERNSLAGLVVVGTLIFGDPMECEDLVQDVEQMRLNYNFVVMKSSFYSSISVQSEN